MRRIGDMLIPHRRVNEEALRGSLEQKRMETEGLRELMNQKKRELSYAHSALEEERARRKAAEERIRQEWQAKKEAQRESILARWKCDGVRRRHTWLLRKFGDRNVRLKNTVEKLAATARDVHRVQSRMDRAIDEAYNEGLKAGKAGEKNHGQEFDAIVKGEDGFDHRVQGVKFPTG